MEFELFGMDESGGWIVVKGTDTKVGCVGIPENRDEWVFYPSFDTYGNGGIVDIEFDSDNLEDIALLLKKLNSQ
jgi:hypothetical protein